MREKCKRSSATTYKQMYIQQQRGNPILKLSGPLAPWPPPLVLAQAAPVRGGQRAESSPAHYVGRPAHTYVHPGGREEQAEGADVRKNSRTEGRVLPPTLGRRRDVGDPPPMRGSDRPLKISNSTISRAFILWKNPRAHIGHCKQL